MIRVSLSHPDFLVERDRETHIGANSFHNGVLRRWQPVQPKRRGYRWYPPVWHLAPEWASEHCDNVNHLWKQEEYCMGVSQAVDQSRGLDQHIRPLPTLIMWLCLSRVRESPASGLTWSPARSRSKWPAKGTGKRRMSIGQLLGLPESTIKSFATQTGDESHL